jgi:hypothetical protein
MSITKGETKKNENARRDREFATPYIMVQGGKPLLKPSSLRQYSDHTTKEDEGRPRATAK